MAQLIKDVVWLNKNYGCNGFLPFGTDSQALPNAPSSVAIVSLTAPGRESRGPYEFPAPCPVLTSGIAITIWNATHVFRVLCLWIWGSVGARTTSSRI